MSAGRRRYFSCVSGSDPGGAFALTGRMPSQRPKMRMRMIPVTNSGTTVSERPPSGDDPVDSGVASQRGDDAAEDRERDDDDERDRGELHRVDEGVAEQLADGHVVGERVSEVSVEKPREPVPVLREDRAVGAELVVQVLDRGLVGEGAEDAPGDVAREHLGADEDEHAQEKKRDEGEAESFEQEPSHHPPERGSRGPEAPADCACDSMP